MKAYNDLLKEVLENGIEGDDRTGTGTRSLFGLQFKHDMCEGFPAVTTKRLAWRSVVGELLWFLNGSTNIERLRQITHNVTIPYSPHAVTHEYNENVEYAVSKGQIKTIWDENWLQQGGKELGYHNGYTGRIYGKQWRDFGCVEFTSGETTRSVDQIKTLLAEAEANPSSRRLIVTAWNPLDIHNPHKVMICDDKDEFSFTIEDDFAILPPCHVMFQVNIQGDFIDLMWTQRSADMFLGLPFNIASYGLLLKIFAKLLCKTPRYLVGSIGNAHIYNNHIEQVKEQLSREPYPLPTLSIASNKDNFDDFIRTAVVDNFKLFNYNYHPTIKAPMAV